MSKIRLHGSSSGYMEIAPPAAGSSATVTLPNSAGEILLSDGSAASLTSIPAANIVGVATAGFERTGGFGGGKVLQVVQNTTTTRHASTSSSFVATDHLVTITPTAASSKILLQFTGDVNTQGDNRNLFVDIYRSINGGTFAGIAPVGSSQSVNSATSHGFFNARGSSSRIQVPFAINYLDSPSYSVGNAIVYKLYARSGGSEIEIPSSNNAQPIINMALEISA